ncbi:hypothetical protein EVG20_g4538 [Dentipellis fragilis]|uniref:Uncharacterized protein n=1 Tax=Dentipellis fragilis TaxID=205917 RepID=A0A4Y9YW77_9AGAM|nr:hypothetical protein EVG20_g4538 [Dentipellis fragilis]
MSTPLPLGSQTPHWEKRAQWMLTSQIRVALLTTAGMEREEEGEEERRDARGGDRYEEEESRTRIYKIATGAADAETNGLADSRSNRPVDGVPPSGPRQPLVHPGRRLPLSLPAPRPGPLCHLHVALCLQHIRGSPIATSSRRETDRGVTLDKHSLDLQLNDPPMSSIPFSTSSFSTLFRTPPHLSSLCPRHLPSYNGSSPGRSLAIADPSFPILLISIQPNSAARPTSPPRRLVHVPDGPLRPGIDRHAGQWSPVASGRCSSTATHGTAQHAANRYRCGGIDMGTATEMEPDNGYARFRG